MKRKAFGIVDQKIDALSLAVQSAKIALAQAENSLLAFEQFRESVADGAWHEIERELLHSGCVYFVRERSGRETIAWWDNSGGWRGIDDYLAGPLDAVWIPKAKKGKQ